MQLNKIFNAEDIEVLFAQWENVTGVKPLLLDSDGSVAIGEGEASEYRLSLIHISEPTRH